MNLEALAAKYKTDKLDHGYIPFYEKHLPKAPKRILEIGVKDGRSLAIWAEYFPNTEVHGLDLYEENDIVDTRFSIGHMMGKAYGTGENIFQHKGNQCDWRILEELRQYDFDVIIDDGSHNARDQMMTFFGLFNGKHYFIEDLHCNFDEPYSQDLPELFRAVNIFSDIRRGNEAIPFEGMPIHFQDDKIVCIYAHNHRR